MFQRILLLVALAAAAGCARTANDMPADAITVQAIVETPPVASSGDAADDPAIWVNPADPLLSLVFGTDKDAALNVYDLEGNLLQTLPDGRINNVDLRNGFMLGGQAVTVVAASNRTNDSLMLYVLDPATRQLASAGPAVPTDLGDSDGLCMYRSQTTGEYFVIIDDSGTGSFQQWQLSDDGGQIGAALVREFEVGHRAEGCATDDELGILYVAEEGGALWRYSAEPAGGDQRTEVDRVGGANGLKEDIEGVAIWYGAGGQGFVVVSNQGANNYAVYRREGNNEFVGIFYIVSNDVGGIDGTSDTDGIDVTSQALGPLFPEGMLVVQDGQNTAPSAKQNFKFVSWQAIRLALGLPGG